MDKPNMWDYYQTGYRESFAWAAPRADLVFSLLKKRRPSGTVLDVGFGDGHLLRRLAAASYRCQGLDYSQKNVDHTREIFSRDGLSIPLAQGSITEAPFGVNSFDAVIAVEVLEHLSDKDVSIAIGEVFRILKPGGIFVATVPADEVLEESRCCCPNCNTVFHRWGHQQSFSCGKLTALMGSVFPGRRVTVTREIFKDTRLNLIGSLLYGFRKLKLALGLTASEVHYVITTVKE